MHIYVLQHSLPHVRKSATCHFLPMGR